MSFEFVHHIVQSARSSSIRINIIWHPLNFKTFSEGLFSKQSNCSALSTSTNKLKIRGYGLLDDDLCTFCSTTSKVHLYEAMLLSEQILGKRFVKWSAKENARLCSSKKFAKKFQKIFCPDILNSFCILISGVGSGVGSGVYGFSTTSSLSYPASSQGNLLPSILLSSHLC